MVWATLRKAPKKAYFEFLIHPLTKILKTLKEDKTIKINIE